MQSVQYTEFSEAEPLELQNHFKSLNQDIQLTVANGDLLKADVQHVVFGTFNIWQGRFACPMVLTCPQPPDSVCILFPLEGSIVVNTASAEFHSTPGTLTVVNFSALRSVRYSEGSDHIGLAFRTEDVIRKLSAIIGSPIVREVAFSAQISETDKGSIFDTIRLMWNQAKSSSEYKLCPSYFEKIVLSILINILYNVPHVYHSRLKGTPSPVVPRQVKKACTYILNSLEKGITSRDIAQHCDVSVRSLQSVFRQFKDCTPIEFLTEMRLLRARSMLKTTPDVSIAEIARSCGFNHPGRFASIYKNAYGEFPNETAEGAKRQFWPPQLA